MRWLIYTVLVGLVPLLARLLAWAATMPGTVEPITAADLIAFGLVLHISNINEVEHLPKNDPMKSLQHGFSFTFIALYGVLLAVTLVGNTVTNNDSVLALSCTMALVSLGISSALQYRLSAASEAVNERA